MTEVDVTRLFDGEVETWDLSGSKATHGPDAGPRTWKAANEQAADTPFLRTDDELDAMRRWAKETGAWDAAERASWSPQEVNALFLQLVVGDMREAGLEDAEIGDNKAWRKYEKGAKEGCWSGNLYRQDGKVYYSLSN